MAVSIAISQAPEHYPSSGVRRIERWKGRSCTSENGPPRASRTTSCVNRCREHGMTHSPSCPDIQVSTRRSRVPDARSWNACRLASDALQTTYTDDGANEQMGVRPTSSQPTGPPHAPHARPLNSSLHQCISQTGVARVATLGATAVVLTSKELRSTGKRRDDAVCETWCTVCGPIHQSTTPPPDLRPWYYPRGRLPIAHAFSQSSGGESAARQPKKGPPAAESRTR